MASGVAQRREFLRKGIAVALVLGVGAALYISGEVFSEGERWGVRIPSLVLAAGVVGLVLAWGLWRWPRRWW